MLEQITITFIVLG